MWLKIERLQDLKLAASDETQDFAIILKGGLLARKRIFYDDCSDLFRVWDLVTDTEGEYTPDELNEDTNIVKAIRQEVFFLETDETTDQTTAGHLQTAMALA